MCEGVELEGCGCAAGGDGAAEEEDAGVLGNRRGIGTGDGEAWAWRPDEAGEERSRFEPFDGVCELPPLLTFVTTTDDGAF